MLNTMQIGKQISQLRKAKGLTGEKLAAALDVSPQAVSKWVNGKCLPETALLPSLAKELGCSVDALFMGYNADELKIVMDLYESADEDKRIAREPLEFIRSKNIISRYLKNDAMEIADVGGATGAYSFWLAEMGHRVHLLDLVQKHVDIAKQRGVEKNLPLASYEVADARSLPYKDESMDIVLLMGALYHLQDRNDRIKCLTEARRVLKPNGVMLCTVISRYSALFGYYKYGHIDAINVRIIDESIQQGKYSNPRGFANAYFHLPNEISSEVLDARFADIQMIAVQGFANAYTPESYMDDEYKLTQMLRHIEMTETMPELLCTSKNIMVAGVKRRFGNE